MDISDVFLCIFILIFILLLFIIIFIIFNSYSPHDLPSRQYLNFDPDSVKTGDILIIGYNHIFGKVLKGFTSSIWSHSGIAYRDKDTNFLYVVELGVYKKLYKGVFKIPFDTWYRINKRQYLGILRYNGPSIDLDKFDTLFTKYKNYTADYFNYKWYRFLLKTKYKPDLNRTKYTCIELTIHILQQLDIYSKSYSCSSYFPSAIGNNKIPTTFGKFYDNVILFNYLPKYDLSLIY
jgi:hypothetical protein